MQQDLLGSLMGVSLHRPSLWCPLSSSVAAEKSTGPLEPRLSHEEVILRSSCPTRGRNIAKAALCPADPRHLLPSRRQLLSEVFLAHAPLCP